MRRMSRTSRIGSLRRTLTVEALETRTLLNGTVTAALDPSTGVLQITGDSADNQFTIAPAPTAGLIRISGNPDTLTTINGETFADFSLDDITGIQMTLLEGTDSVTVADFSIPGALTVVYGNLADEFSLPNFEASAINLVFAEPPASSGVLGSGQNAGLLPPVGSGDAGHPDDLLPPVEGTGGVLSTGNTNDPFLP